MVAAKVLAAMASEVCLEGHVLRLRPSIGIAVQRGPDRNAARLMQAADEAMYKAKRADGPGYAVLEC